jgi:predicted transcriptional regulator of viral defense system
MDRKTQVLKIVEEKGVIKAGDIEAEGISRSYLYVLHNSGLLQKITRGLYALPGTHVSEHITLIEIAKRIPNAIICLLSALGYYDLTTQLPHEVWITIPRGAWRPKTDYPSLNLTYASKEVYSYGVLEHKINGVSVKIYSPAKTIADCFKFRNKIGLDIAIEALRKGWETKKIDMDELVKAAKICKVSKVIRPYLEAIV